ncbi:uncharacterized protein LOC119082018 [Bradysia coprophila]|uniref:uncharacterized protein LOC119082018 n=1 Tax=Bradysia coprophila TaxID=38358 RepID=UPI00187DB75D|nr:uncharacterized protein LOC119082018 [Bradysia coprophila]
MLNECGMEDTEDASGVTSKTIEIELENGINIDELGAITTDDTDTVVNACVQLGIPRDIQTDPDNHQPDENIWNCRERIVSKYSHEQSTIEYQSLNEPRVTSRDNENDKATGDVQQQVENGQQPDDANVMDLDNYVSPYPSTSSSISNTTIPPYPSRCYDPKTGEIIIARIANQARVRLFF